MLKISEAIKNKYRNDKMPYLDKPINKSLYLYFPALNLTVTNDKINGDSMSLTESICEEEELTFGGCNAAEFCITLADIEEDLNGQIFVVTQTLDDNPNYKMPLGTYKVNSCKRQSDRRFKDIVAYDMMLNTDKDVTAWYNSRPWRCTLKTLRESLLVYCNIDYEVQNLPNDGLQINKTIRPANMNGRDILKLICELNGTFGHITRDNKFKCISLSGLGLYPAENLYPSEELFPAEASEKMNQSNYRPESTYEDYYCRAIDQLRIRTTEDDIGIIVNNGKAGTNEYIIQGNFFIADKTAAQLTDVAKNIFRAIANKYYRPHNMIVDGLPYLEVGDSISIITTNDIIETFIFSRTLSGIQALTDSLSATGHEYRQNKVGLSIQISQLEKAATDIQDNITDIESDITGIEDNITGIEDNITGIEEDITDLTTDVGDIQTEIVRMNDQIALRVTNGQMQSAITIAIDNIHLTSEKISMEGYVSINGGFSVGRDGSLTINKGSVNIVTDSASSSVIILSYAGWRVLISPSQFLLSGGGGQVAITPTLITMGNTRLGDSYLVTRNMEAQKGTFDSVTIGGRTPYTSINEISSGNTVTGISTSGGTLRISYAYRCTFSGTSSSSTPNARVSSGGNVAQCASSSQRYKADIKALEDLDAHKLYDIPVRQYRYREGYLSRQDERYGKTFPGFIAEEIDQILPFAVDHQEDGKPEMWNINIMFPLLVQLVQEQKAEIDTLKAENRTIKDKLKERGIQIE